MSKTTDTPKLNLNSPIGKTEADSIVVTKEDVVTALNQIMEYLDEMNYDLVITALNKLLTDLEG